MTEKFVREVAERFGLEVLKRITTGSAYHHFATFELSGPAERVRDAWPVIAAKSGETLGRLGAMDSVQHVSNPEHPDHNKPYIECGSIWCEPEPVGVSSK